IKEIISLIASGTYTDGQRLPAERKLCEKFSASRGTIRQSLADLEKIGIVKIKPGSGAYIQKFSYRKLPERLLPPDFRNVSIADIIQARKIIESAAIETACDKITAKELEQLSRLTSEMERTTNDLPRFVKLDMDFHQMIVKASRNMVLVTAFEAIFEYHKYSQVFTSLNQGQEDIAVDYHKKILGALCRKNSRIGRKALAKHLDKTAEAGKNLSNLVTNT
ncbi:MAG: FadR/GntR family transcriptional regulator, partial [Planctomycetota bacterium]